LYCQKIGQGKIHAAKNLPTLNSWKKHCCIVQAGHAPLIGIMIIVHIIGVLIQMLVNATRAEVNLWCNNWIDDVSFRFGWGRITNHEISVD
jgi:hypothetical protein